MRDVWLSGQPSGSAAADEDIGERSAVNVVAREAMNLSRDRFARRDPFEFDGLL
jgi:hypothetical protein